MHYVVLLFRTHQKLAFKDSFKNLKALGVAFLASRLKDNPLRRNILLTMGLHILLLFTLKRSRLGSLGNQILRDPLHCPRAGSSQLLFWRLMEGHTD